MNILVTGSNGFIGQHVCTWLQAQGSYVIGLGRSQNPVGAPNRYIRCDLDTPAIAERLPEAGRIDAVIHLAANMNVEPHNIEVVQSNCVGTQRLLEACQACDIPVFVQLSSLPVIGRPIEHPITEEHPVCPPTVYHVTKLTEELLADYAARRHGLRTASFRICAPIGPGMNPKTIFPTFVRNALAGKDLVLFGKGTRKQTYIHVNDIAQALLKAVESEASQGVYNLASRCLVSNAELADRCIRLLDSSSSVTFNGLADEADSDIWDVSIDRIESDLGFKPETDIDSAIVEYAAWLDCKRA